MPADAAIARAHAGDAIAVVENLGRGEAGEDVDAFGFDQPAQPFHEAVQRNDVVAVVLERRGREGKGGLAAAGEEVDVIVVHQGAERRAALLEVGDQVAERARIEHRAREHVRAGLPRLLEHRDGERLAAALLLQLCQPQCRRHPRRAAPDDENVYLEGFTLHRQPSIRRHLPRSTAC